MKKKINILIADFLPLDNKGEEAILRGIEDLFADEYQIIFGIFGYVDNITPHGKNIIIFPVKWVYDVFWAKTSYKKSLVYKITLCFKYYFGIYGKLKNLFNSKDSNKRPLNDFFTKADCILVGHDGFFNPVSTGIVHIAKSRNKLIGIFGAGFILGSHLYPFAYPLYRRALKESVFCILREKTAYNLLKKINPTSFKPILALDPAFYMHPASLKCIKTELGKYEFYKKAKLNNKPIVGVTVCEKSIVFHSSFLYIKDIQIKKFEHANFIAKLLDALIESFDVKIIFLPHSIEKIGNDIEVSKLVKSVMKFKSETLILEKNWNARTLKGIIKELDFLIGERTHSLIGALSVQTPFIGLTNTSDIRTHDIIGDMCQCEDLLINMDYPNIDHVIEKVLKIYNNKETYIEKINKIYTPLIKNLEITSKLIKQKIINEKNK